MALWRQVSTVLLCVLLASFAGCTPATNRPMDEEKELHFTQGRNRERRYDYAGAIESYHRALEVNPKSAAAHYRLGLLYDSQGQDPAAAIYHFERFLRLQPDSEQAHPIGQRIVGCKQQLAKEVSLGLVSGEMKNQLDELVSSTQKLTEENRRLSEENQRLRDQLARAQPGLAAASPAGAPAGPSVTPTVGASYTPPSSSATSHTVQKGDTYYSIARRYGISTAALQAANPGVNPQRLNIGQRLAIPSR